MCIFVSMQSPLHSTPFCHSMGCRLGQGEGFAELEYGILPPGGFF